MFKNYIFEADCADLVGHFKVADAIDKKMQYAASLQGLISKIKKQFNQIKNIEVNKNKVKVQFQGTMSKKDKEKVRQMLDDHKVIFKMASKSIDDLMAGDNSDELYNFIGKTPRDILDRHIEQVKNQKNEDWYDIEPSDFDLELEDVPGDDLDYSPDSMDTLMLEHARKHMNKMMD